MLEWMRANPECIGRLMWPCLGWTKTRQTAAFWLSCKDLVMFEGTSARRELKQSHRDYNWLNLPDVVEVPARSCHHETRRSVDFPGWHQGFLHQMVWPGSHQERWLGPELKFPWMSNSSLLMGLRSHCGISRRHSEMQAEACVDDGENDTMSWVL